MQVPYTGSLTLQVIASTPSRAGANRLPTFCGPGNVEGTFSSATTLQQIGATGPPSFCRPAVPIPPHFRVLISTAPESEWHHLLHLLSGCQRRFQSQAAGLSAAGRRKWRARPHPRIRKTSLGPSWTYERSVDGPICAQKATKSHPLTRFLLLESGFEAIVLERMEPSTFWHAEKKWLAPKFHP